MTESLIIQIFQDALVTIFHTNLSNHIRSYLHKLLVLILSSFARISKILKVCNDGIILILRKTCHMCTLFNGDMNA